MSRLQVSHWRRRSALSHPSANALRSTAELSLARTRSIDFELYIYDRSTIIDDYHKL